MNRRQLFKLGVAAAAAAPVAALAAKLPLRSTLAGGELFIGGRLVGSFSSVSFDPVASEYLVCVHNGRPLIVEDLDLSSFRVVATFDSTPIKFHKEVS